MRPSLRAARLPQRLPDMATTVCLFWTLCHADAIPSPRDQFAMRLPDLRVGVSARPMPEQENRLTLNGACIPSAKWPKKFSIGPLLASAEGVGFFTPIGCTREKLRLRAATTEFGTRCAHFRARFEGTREFEEFRPVLRTVQLTIRRCGAWTRRAFSAICL